MATPFVPEKPNGNPYFFLREWFCQKINVYYPPDECHWKLKAVYLNFMQIQCVLIAGSLYKFFLTVIYCNGSLNIYFVHQTRPICPHELNFTGDKN